MYNHGMTADETPHSKRPMVDIVKHASLHGRQLALCLASKKRSFVFFGARQGWGRQHECAVNCGPLLIRK